MKRSFVFVVCLTLSVLISGCSWLGWMQDKSMTRSTPVGLYQKGSELYQKKKYEKAITIFQRLKDEYPLEEISVLAEIGIADAHYSKKSYTDAYLAYDEFINRHPTDENVPYAMYQMGMSRYQMIDTIDRDQTETWKAKADFERLLSRYPKSQFVVMAQKMLREVKTKLAENEFYIGKFYFKSKKYKAALKRFEVIARDFPNIGLDYKVKYYITETRRMLSEERAENEKTKTGVEAEADGKMKQEPDRLPQQMNEEPPSPTADPLPDEEDGYISGPEGSAEFFSDLVTKS
ncbi:MAG: outer membrane protein assembly factor BamD [Syntrophales bacterium]|jgi:outer membrane protein assembly factor BamD|nr:outer membrane protein assembly factor BamD [Syntrophales bacterium]